MNIQNTTKIQTLFLLCAITMLGIWSSLVSNAVASPLTLARDGQTTYSIALADDAIPAEKTAAEQLQKYLQQITGATLTILPADAANTGPQILVGAGKQVKALLPETNWAALGPDGIVVKTVGNNLVLAGGRPRGTLYAVFEFLEQAVGCRWWTPTESTVPKKSTLQIGEQNTVFIPPFNYREHYTNSVQADPVFATIMRENGLCLSQTAEWGGHYNMLGGVHTFSILLPLEKYFKDHPEWYSDPTNGHLPCTKDSPMPDAQATNPCLTNPDVLAEVTKNALEMIAKDPTAGYISISQNDNREGYCRDAAAMKLIEEEGSPAAPLLKFVNAVAGEIEKKYPDIIVETLAYRFSEKPPKTIRPAKNVMIRLAPLDADFGHPLDSKWNKEVHERLKSWSQISQQLFVWNYITNFSGNILPYPNWNGIAKDLRLFANNKVTGIFQQGDCYTNGVGDFVQLRTWVVAKLMWNPNLDQDKLIDEFMAGYYGPAAGPLRKYIDNLQRSYLAQNRKLTAFDRDLKFFTLDVTNESIRLFDQAEAAVKDDPDRLKRVQRERLALTVAVLFRYGALKREAARHKREFLGPKEPMKAFEEFVKQAKALGIKDWKEGYGFNREIRTVREMLEFTTQFEN